MAKKNPKTQQSRSLLGVIDERITDKHSDITWSTNKIGGRPDWIQANIPFPRCRVCERELCLIVQLYCPLDGSPYHRCMYVFGCINDPCWSNSDSWVAIRSEKLGDTTCSTSTVETGERSPADEWLENADDWEEDNGNRPSEESQLIRQQLNNQNWMEADNRNVIDDYVRARQLEAFRNLDLNLVEGAVGLEPTCEASAETESPDEGTITVETPDGPTPETTSLLFTKPPCKPRDISVVLKSWFLAVLEEPSIQSQNQLNEHERDLLARYQKRDGVNFNELFNRGKIGNGDSRGIGEVYEKTAPKHGDRIFYKLLTKLRLCPQQVLRYSSEGDACPLLVSPASVDMLDPGNCQMCGEKRMFEFQLMPSVIEFLQPEDNDTCAIEFGTLVVYTCRASCWKEGDLWREERVVAQSDPDSAHFDTLFSREAT